MAKNDFFDTVKPHTLLKLKVLEKYLDTYSEIMGRVFPSIAFIDAYAGRGKCRDDNNKEYDGSPIIMCKAIRRILDIERGKCKKAKYFANDIDKKNCSLLEANLSPFGEIANISSKEAKEFISECLSKICPQYSSALFFVDPFNYSILKADIESIFNTCEEYFNRCQCEVILFLPISNVYRFKTNNEYPSIVNFVESYGINPEEDKHPDKFMERVRQAFAGIDKYCASVKLKDGANTYALFFIGKHIYGIDKFLEARDKCLKQDTDMELFVLPETPTGKLKSKIKEKPMFNWEIYEWAMKNNISAARIKDMIQDLEIKEKLKKEYINCKKGKNTYYLNNDGWKDRSKQIKYYFEEETWLLK